jgi:hypothetical protein
MPRLPRSTLNKFEQKYWDWVVLVCVNTLRDFNYQVDERTIFTNGKSIGAFRSLLNYSVRPRGRLEKKVVKLILQETEAAYNKTYLNHVSDT